MLSPLKTISTEVDDGVQRPELTIDQLTQLGAHASQHGLADVARVAFLRALAIEPRADVLANVANAMRYTWRFDEANQYLAAALERAPMDGRVWGIAGAIYLDQNRAEEAIDAFRKAIQWGGAGPYTRFGLAEAQLHAGDFSNGLLGYDSRFELNPLRLHNCPRWKGEPLGGRLLHVEAEQGLGDTIMFSRFLSRIPGDYVLSVQPALQGLFGPNTKRLGEDVRADYWTPLMSLPRHVGTDVTPALMFRPNRNMPLTNKGDFNIGIFWQSKAGGAGSPEEKRHGLQKSCSLELFLELAEIDGVQLHSLQHDQDAHAMTMGLINQLPQYDFRDQASYMMQLDCIVGVDTAPIHLAATLRRPTILMLNVCGSWQWGAGKTTAWYDTMQIVRQEKPFDWRSAIRRVKELVFRAIREPSEAMAEAGRLEFNRVQTEMPDWLAEGEK